MSGRDEKREKEWEHDCCRVCVLAEMQTRDGSCHVVRGRREEDMKKEWKWMDGL